MKFSRDSVRLGEPVDLTLQLLLPTNSKINTLQLALDSLQALGQRIDPADSSMIPYEVLNYGTWTAAKDNKFLPAQLNWQTQAIADGRQLFQNTIKMVIWEPGYFALPPSLAEVELPRGVYDINSNPAAIGILLPDQSQISGVDSSGLAPIKPILREAPASIMKKVLLGLLAVLALGFLLYYFVLKKKSTEETVVEIPPTPEEVAMAALQDIEQRGDWDKGLLKKYYDELTYVLRKYLEDRMGVKALESTTDEILHDLRALKLEPTWVDGLKKLLPMTDMVKFAKLEPHDEAHRDWLSWSRSLVDAHKNTMVKANQGEVLLQLQEKKWKSLAVFEEQLWLSKIKTSSKKIFNGGIGIPFNRIQQLSFKADTDELLIHYMDEKDNNEKEHLVFVSPESLHSFVEELNGLLGLTKTNEGETVIYLRSEKN